MPSAHTDGATAMADRPHARILPVDPERVTGAGAELLGELSARGSRPGPMVLTMALAPALLRGYVDLSRAMKRSRLDRRVSERIALAVQQWIGCDLCLAAHSAAAHQLGLSHREIALARQGTSSDPKVAAIVAFGLQVHVSPSEITDGQVRELQDLGYTDEQIVEVVGLVALQVLTGALNVVSGNGSAP